MNLSIPPSVRQELSTIYNYMHELSRTLSILSTSEDLELQAPVEKGWVKIKFVDRPRAKYFVHPSYPRTIVEVANSTVPTPPHIDLGVEDGSFGYAAVPSVIIEGDQYTQDPITALALAKIMMRRARYDIEASHQALKDFVTRFFSDMDDDTVISSAELMIREFTKDSRIVSGPDIELIVESTPQLFIYYHANGYPKPFITAGIYIEGIELPGEDGELEPSILSTPILGYTGNTVRLCDDLSTITSLVPGFQINRFINTLSRVGTSKVLEEVKNWLPDFIQEFAKAVITAKMYNI